MHSNSVPDTHPPSPLDQASNNSQFIDPHLCIHNLEQTISLISSAKYSCLSVNIQNISWKFAQLKDIVKAISPDIIMLSEIWLNSPDYYSIESFHPPIFTLREGGKNGGGTGIYLSTDLKIIKNSVDFSNTNFHSIEFTHTTIEFNTQPLNLVAIYRPPDKPQTQSLKEIEKLLSKLCSSGAKFLIGGDCNIDYNNNNSFTDKYKELIADHHCRQLIEHSTRLTLNSATCIDHLISNISSAEGFVNEFCPADHQVTIATWKGKKVKPKKSENSSTREKLNFEKSLENLESIDWKAWQQTVSELDSHETYHSFQLKIREALVFKEVKAKGSRANKDWMTHELLKKRDKVYQARRLAFKKGTPHYEQKYTNLKKEYNADLKSAEKAHYNNLLDAAGFNSKSIWRIINTILGRTNQISHTKKILDNGVEIEDDTSIAKAFNHFFKDKSFNLAQMIEPQKHFSDFLINTEKIQGSFAFQPTNVFKTFKLIRNLKAKNSSGFDGLSSKLLKAVAISISSPITSIINKCFSFNEFPSELKISKLNPLFKKGNPTLLNSYRPISQNSCISGIIEKTCIEQLVEHDLKNNITSDTQFGFRKLHSTSHAALLVRHFIEQERAKKNHVILISTDLSSAFDTINTVDILPGKMLYFGMSNESIKFLKSFFHCRKQYTTWNNKKSDLINLHNISVVQGSSLGPLAFNLYVNDLANSSTFFTVQFADDSIFLLSAKNLDSLLEEAQSELNTILDYMSANYLSVNHSKCEFLVIRPSQRSQMSNLALHIGNSLVVESDTIKFLGVIFDYKINFKAQIKNVTSKLKKATGALIRTKEHLDYKSKLQIYNGLVKHTIEYCSICWLDKATKGEMMILSRLQKRCIRLIFRARFNSHTAKLFHISHIMPIQNIYEREAVYFIKKYQNNNLPKAFTTLIGDFSAKACQRKNQKYNIKIPPSYKPDQALYKIINAWNNCDIDLRVPSTLAYTKSLFSNLVFDQLDKLKCPSRNCFMCKRDAHIDFQKYAGKKSPQNTDA